MKTFRLLLVIVAMTLVGCGPQSKKVKDDGFKVTASTNEIIANGKKSVNFTATFDGKLLHEKDPQLSIMVDSAIVQLPDMKFSTDKVGNHEVVFAYTEKSGEQHIYEPFEVKATKPAPIHATILLIAFYLLSPAAILWACNRWKVLNKIGPVLLLYIVGIIIANLNLIPEGCKGLQDTISTIAIPLALPMMLYSCNFKKFSVTTSLKITIIGVVASMANFRTMNYEGVLYIVLFQLVVVFGSLLLTMLGAKLFKVDGDTTIITSNTLINSPIFVPMIAASMKNKDIIVVGVTIGLVGYAVGNYFGYMMFSLLTAL